MAQLGSNTSGHLFDTSFNSNGVLYSASAGVITSTTVGTAGEVLTSNGTGVAPTFQVAGGDFAWNDASGAFSPLANNGYFVTGTATGTLPASPVQGDTIKFFVDHATQDLTIDAPGTQLIRFGSAVSSAGGTALSTAQGDSVTLVYRTSDTCWCATSLIGVWVLS